MLAARFGCAERAFDLIERALDRGRPLRGRFPKLCARLGLAQYWVESGYWPDCAGDVDYDFKSACRQAVAGGHE